MIKRACSGGLCLASGDAALIRSRAEVEDFLSPPRLGGELSRHQPAEKGDIDWLSKAEYRASSVLKAMCMWRYRS